MSGSRSKLALTREMVIGFPKGLELELIRNSKGGMRYPRWSGLTSSRFIVRTARVVARFQTSGLGSSRSTFKTGVRKSQSSKRQKNQRSQATLILLDPLTADYADIADGFICAIRAIRGQKDWVHSLRLRLCC